jgi:hypothetical protein
LIRKLLQDDSGYSLVEVIVSIMILTVAIIPMVVMFDTGLRAVTSSGNYDTARSLANGSMEQIKALPYDRPGGAADSVVEKFAPGAPRGCPLPAPSNFTCVVNTRYADATMNNFQDSPKTPWMQVEIRAGWGSDPDRITITGYVGGQS